MTKTVNPDGFIERVRDETKRYVREIVEENRKLRTKIAVLETNKAKLEDTVSSQQRQLHQIEERLSTDQSHHELLERRLEDIELESRELFDRYSLVEKQNTALANLYVAAYRLHSTMDRAEVLEAIVEIIVNLVGCEEFGIFEVIEKDAMLTRVAEFGLPEDRLQRVTFEDGIIGRTAASGKPFFFSDTEATSVESDEANLTACVPLTLGGRVHGLIATFKLLPQKDGRFAELDHELFDLLGSQAAYAMQISKIHADQ